MTRIRKSYSDFMIGLIMIGLIIMFRKKMYGMIVKESRVDKTGTLNKERCLSYWFYRFNGRNFVTDHDIHHFRDFRGAEL